MADSSEMTEKYIAECIQVEVNFRLEFIIHFIVEILLNILTVFGSFVIGLVLVRTKTFSRHPKIQLFNLQFAAFLVAVTRFVLISQYITKHPIYFPPVFLNFNRYIHDCAVNVNTFNQVAITAECILSTYWPGLTERMTTKWGVRAISFTWPWLVTIVIYVLEQLNVFETTTMFVALELLNLICWIVIIHLYIVNRRKYKQVEHGNLSGKYQLIVNIRTVRSLDLLSILSAIRNSLLMAVQLIVILYFKPNCYYYATEVAYHTYDSIVTLYSVFWPLVLVLSHQEFRKHFLRFTSWRKNDVHSQHNPNVLRNAFGENLVLPNTSANYFKQLDASWNQGPRPSMITLNQDHLMSNENNRKRSSTKSTIELNNNFENFQRPNSAHHLSPFQVNVVE